MVAELLVKAFIKPRLLQPHQINRLPHPLVLDMSLE